MCFHPQHKSEGIFYHPVGMESSIPVHLSLTSHGHLDWEPGESGSLRSPLSLSWPGNEATHLLQCLASVKWLATKSFLSYQAFSFMVLQIESKVFLGLTQSTSVNICGLPGFLGSKYVICEGKRQSRELTTVISWIPWCLTSLPSYHLLDTSYVLYIIDLCIIVLYIIYNLLYM